MPGAVGSGVRESRTLLSDYYGLQHAASPGPEDSSSDEKDEFPEGQVDVFEEMLGNTLSQDPLDRDDFELDTYVHDLLSKSTVKELIGMDSAIIGEIRTLDNDLQMLVYENYAKFIAATDIIKEMQIKVDDIHSDMDSLKSTVDTLGNYYTAAEQVIDPSRSDIERLLGLSRLVGKMNFLFDLPNRLRSEISKQNYDQAISMFTNSAKILEQYSLVKSFQEIRKDSEQILKDLKLKLRSDLQSYENAKGVQLISTATLLLKLDEEPSLLWHDILSSKRDWFLITLERAKKNTTGRSHMLKNQRMCFADEFVEFITGFRNLFLPALPGAASPNVSNQTAKTTPRTIQDDALVALNSFSRQALMMYIEDARSTLNQIVEDICASKLSEDEHHVQLELLVNEVKSMTSIVSAAENILPTSQLGARYKEVTDAIIKRTIVSVFTRCHLNILKSVAEYVQDRSPIIIPKSDECIKQVHEHLKSASQDVNLICTYHPQADKLILDLFLNALENVQVLLLGDNGVLHSECAVVINAQKYEIRKSLAAALTNPAPLILLRLSKLCIPCQGYALPELFEYLAGLFPSLSASPAFNKKCAMLLQLFKDTEKVLLNVSGRQAGTVMSSFLRGPILDITVAPTRPSDRLFGWKNALQEYHQHLLGIYPQRAAEAQPRQPIVPSRPMRRNDIQRMFTQTHTTPMFVNVEPNLESLLHSSIKVAFKAWIERVRLETFTALQFQQMQVDVYMARVNIPFCLNASRSILDTLLDEVVTSAMDTCPEGSPELPPNLVQQYGSVSK